MTRSFVLILSISLLAPLASAGEIVLTSWNILNYPGSTGTARNPYFQTVLSSSMPDLLVVQEIIGQSGVTRFLDEVLDVLEPGEWAAASYHDGYDTDNALYYRIDAVEETGYGWLDTALRDIDWWELRVTGSGEEFRLYSLHLKASQGSTEEQKRLNECIILRSDLDALSPDLPYIVAGDYNIYYADEPAYQHLISAGAGQLHDPIDQEGYWHDNASYASIHTQSTRTASFGGGATGGMDDRFDIILASDDLLDGAGFDLLPETYTAYGNDGAHFNLSIIEGGNTAVPSEVAEAIYQSSDHLPLSVTLSTDDATLVAGAPPVMGDFIAAPNPFNPSTTIHFRLDREGTVDLVVYDASGRLVRTLASGHYGAGERELVWDGRDRAGREVASGVYFARLAGERTASIIKLLLIR